MASTSWLLVLPLLLLCYNSYGQKKWSNQWTRQRLNKNPYCLYFKLKELEGTCNNTNLMARGRCIVSTEVEKNPASRNPLEKAFRTCYQYKKPLRLTTTAPSTETTTAATAVTNATTSSTTSTTTVRTTTTTRRILG